jgi:hypothetical protein
MCLQISTEQKVPASQPLSERVGIYAPSMAYLGIALGAIALTISGFMIYRTRRDWEREWAKRRRVTK